MKIALLDAGPLVALYDRSSFAHAHYVHLLADRRIDWIFVRGAQLESITSVTTRWNHRYPSDHFPLVATLRLP